MKKTRNLFILKGSPSDVNLVLGNLHFKGLTELTSSEVTVQDVVHEFNNNKSVVCSNVPKGLEVTAIDINVINSSDPNDMDENCINIMDGCLPQKFAAIADAYDCDIGDHKSNSSGLTGVPSSKDCPYCMYFLSNPLTRRFDESNRTIYESDNFVVMPTVGEFIKGYLLIIPREHVMSMAELSPELREEFLSVLEDVIFILKLTYHVNDILVWENGTGNGGLGKAKSSIVHSHVHVAPSKLTAEAIQGFSGFSLTKISYENLPLYGKHSYLLVKGSTNNEWWINDNPDLYIPRQYVRQLIAEEYCFLGDTWNWRTNPFIYLITATCNDIQDALIFNWKSIPERIKENTKKFLVF